jgi:hypothetical protein
MLGIALLDGQQLEIMECRRMVRLVLAFRTVQFILGAKP